MDNNQSQIKGEYSVLLPNGITIPYGDNCAFKTNEEAQKIAVLLQDLFDGYSISTLLGMQSDK